MSASGVRLPDADGRVTGTLLVLHDVTRLRRLEQTRAEFVQNASPELRTPLTAVKGALEALQGGALQDAAQAGRFVNMAAKHVDHLVELLEDLSQITRLSREEGGKVYVRAFRDDSRAVFEVRDEGCGIKSRDLPHIFDPFYRTQAGRTMDPRGTGLGLTLVRRIADIHGGTIDVQSEVGKGSTFSLCIPAA